MWRRGLGGRLSQYFLKKNTKSHQMRYSKTDTIHNNNSIHIRIY